MDQQPHEPVLGYLYKNRFLCSRNMSIFIASLNSGSNGNCYYIGNNDHAILIDAGISCRETERRMTRLGLSMSKVKAVFISHEHTDHIRGISVLARKYQLPVYITPDTMSHGRLELPSALTHTFTADIPVTIGNLHVTAFIKLHDAIEPHSFVVSDGRTQIGIFTDIGLPCERLTQHFSQCHAAFLEANYDEEMLEKGRYPYYLKKRIRGGKGHLSNTQALEVFLKYRPAFMTHLLLSHLSQDNNNPQLVQQLFDTHAGHTNIIVASRHEESAVFQINATPAGNTAYPLPSQQPIAIQALLFP